MVQFQTKGSSDGSLASTLYVSLPESYRATWYLAYRTTKIQLMVICNTINNNGQFQPQCETDNVASNLLCLRVLTVIQNPQLNKDSSFVSSNIPHFWSTLLWQYIPWYCLLCTLSFSSTEVHCNHMNSGKTYFS